MLMLSMHGSLRPLPIRPHGRFPNYAQGQLKFAYGSMVLGYRMYVENHKMY
jgi:hypothetical protein